MLNVHESTFCETTNFCRRLIFVPGSSRLIFVNLGQPSIKICWKMLLVKTYFRNFCAVHKIYDCDDSSILHNNALKIDENQSLTTISKATVLSELLYSFAFVVFEFCFCASMLMISIRNCFVLVVAVEFGVDSLFFFFCLVFS